MQNGHAEVCFALRENNANLNDNRGNDATPQLKVAQKGHTDLNFMPL